MFIFIDGVSFETFSVALAKALSDNDCEVKIKLVANEQYLCLIAQKN